MTRNPELGTLIVTGASRGIGAAMGAGVLWPLSPAASYTTGAILQIGGGH
jgi:hypothetical protein